jgi:hypothetical protein
VEALQAIIADASARGLRPWIAVKERLSEAAIGVLARGEPRIVLQGGAALHFAYGSPRLSADVDVVGADAGTALARQGPALARVAGDQIGCPAGWSMKRAGRLWRGKVTLEIGSTRRLALPFEALEVPAHRPVAHPKAGLVEDPCEIVADKLVASADRFARRGTLKATDLFDLWFLVARLGSPLPDLALIARKLEDYEQARRGADLRSAVLAFSAEEMRAAIEGLVPASELRDLDARRILETAAALVERYHDAL